MGPPFFVRSLRDPHARTATGAIYADPPAGSCARRDKGLGRPNHAARACWTPPSSGCGKCARKRKKARMTISGSSTPCILKYMIPRAFCGALQKYAADECPRLRGPVLWAGHSIFPRSPIPETVPLVIPDSRRAEDSLMQGRHAIGRFSPVYPRSDCIFPQSP